MADQILDQIRDVVEGQIDFEGQRMAELLASSIMTLLGVVAFVAGYVLQDIKLALYILLGGTAISFVLLVPPWPFFRRHPVKWLPVGGGPQAVALSHGTQNVVIDEKAFQ